MKNLILLALLVSLCSYFASCSKDEDAFTDISDEIDNPIDNENCTGISTFTINLDPNECTVNIESSLGVSSQYTETVNGTTRTIIINNIANHQVGVFPRNGNPNAISEQSHTYTLSTNPSLAGSTTSVQGYDMGVLFSGVSIEPHTAEFFETSSGGFNRDWNITTLTSTVNLGLDCNNAHVQPTGKIPLPRHAFCFSTKLRGRWN